MALSSRTQSVALVLVIASVTSMYAPAMAKEAGFEDPGAAGAGPFITGAIDGASKVMGHRGFLIVRSPQRWEQIREALASLGWKSPANDPERARERSAHPTWKDPSDSPLAKVDFTRDVVVAAFACGDLPFPSHWVASNPKESEVRFLLSCPQVIMNEEDTEWGAVPWMFGFATVPKAERVKVALSHFDPSGTIEDAYTLWAETFDASRGDVVDGLSAVITPKEKRIKAGADILIDLNLVFQIVKSFPWQHPPDNVWRESAFVWDGKFSQGYRNSAYLVAVPDGTTHLLRRPEQKWAKNAPHLEEITAEKPYALPTQSVKELGLDTSKPGVYRVTAVYMESGGPGETSDGKKVEIWGGNIASGTVEVEVAE